MKSCLPAAAVFAAAAAAMPPVEDLLHQLDQLYRSNDSHAQMEMHIVTENWERTLEMEAWSQGTERTFIRVLSPAREAGSATLRIGSEMWNYRPNTSSTVRIPPSMMTGSWMGSDLTNNDIVKEITYTDDYTAEYIEGPEDSPDGLLYLRLTPRPGTAVVWSYIVSALQMEPLLPVREQYYDRDDRLIKTVAFSCVETFGERTIPTVMRITPEDQPGESTTVTWSAVAFDAGVNQQIFTLANLQSEGRL